MGVKGPGHSPWGLLVVPQPDTKQLLPGEGQCEEMLMGLTALVIRAFLSSLMSMRSLEWPG